MTRYLIGALFSGLCMLPNFQQLKRSTQIVKLLTKSTFNERLMTDKLLEERYYDSKSNLKEKIEYSYVGCNATDSTAFAYGDKNRLSDKLHFTGADVIKKDCKTVYKLSEKFHYTYDRSGRLLRIDVVNDGTRRKTISPPKSLLMIRDSLTLLEDYVSDIQFILSVTKPKHISKIKKPDGDIVKCYFNGTPYVFLTDYGIPDHEFLKSMTVYLTGGRLAKDEFAFRNYFLVRTYFYEKGVLSKVVITTTDNKLKRNGVSVESFVRKPA